LCDEENVSRENIKAAVDEAVSSKKFLLFNRYLFKRKIKDEITTTVIISAEKIVEAIIVQLVHRLQLPLFAATPPQRQMHKPSAGYSLQSGSHSAL
jgi:hypothetical protein